MQNIEFHSHEQQDEFVFNIFNQKRDGFFLDVSCGNPTIGSNTYTLDKFCGWTGFGFDIYDIEANFQWSQKRNGKFVQMDVTSEEFTEYLKANVTQDVDYASVDVDSPLGVFAGKALDRILDAGIRPKAITFEHEYHSFFDEVRGPARERLEGLGYIRLFEDVKLWTCGFRKNDTEYFEDWWILPEHFPTTLLTVATKNLYYFDCIKLLKEHTGNTYNSTHRCSRAFVDEYNLFWHEQERQEFLGNYNQFKRS